MLRSCSARGRLGKVSLCWEQVTEVVLQGLEHGVGGAVEKGVGPKGGFLPV